MAQDQRGTTSSDAGREMSVLEARLTQGVILMFVAVGLFMTAIVLTTGPEELAGGALGRREGLLTLILTTPLRFLMPLLSFGLAGYSYVYLQKHQ